MKEFRCGAQENDGKSKEIIGSVWTGFVELYRDGKYLWRRYSGKISLRKEGAMLNAYTLAKELAPQFGIDPNYEIQFDAEKVQ